MSEMQLYRRKLRAEFLFPKEKLRKERLSRELTTSSMAQLIGLANRKGYEEKESGKMPFKDYEMAVIAKEFGISESDLFFR